LNFSNRRSTRHKNGAILHGLHCASAWLYALILNSAIGRYLTGYKKTTEALSDGFLHRSLRSKRKRSNRLSFRFRQKLSAIIEKSFFCRLVTAIERELLQCSLNSYGIFLLFFGCFSIIAHYVPSNLVTERAHISYLITGGALVLASLPLFASTRSLAYSLRTSRVFSWLLIDTLGIAEERFRSYREKGTERYVAAFICAFSIGALTFLYSPQLILSVIGIVLLILMILRDPEIGMLLSVALCPFMTLTERPTLSLLLLVALSLFSFVVKLLCGKRVWCWEPTDAAVLLLILLYVFGGIVTRGGRASLYSALTYAALMSIYFMIANLVRSQDGVRRLIRVLIGSCTLVALMGLWQHFFTTVEVAYLDLSLFADLGGRIYATWENPNMLAEYLVLLMPLVLARLCTKGRVLRGFGYAICLILLGACLVFTWSRGAWLGAVVSLFLFLLCLNHRALSFAVVAALPVATLLPFIPERITRRFLSIGNLADSSVLYRVNLWEGIKRMLSEHWFAGVGVGENAFCTVYSHYALPGIESAMHAHSLYLQLLCNFGVVGVIVFAVTMLSWLRHALEYYRYGEWRGPRLVVLGGVLGIFALLIMGLFDDIFYNYRIFFMFWAVMGLVTAQLRVGERQSERSYNPVDDERTQGEVTFRFH
jgi:O-antigen ligase